MKNVWIFALLLVATLVVFGCVTVRPPASDNTNLPSYNPTPSPVITPNPTPAPMPGPDTIDDDDDDVMIVLAWEKNHPERAAWTKELKFEIKSNLAAFNEASDWSLYCKKYVALKSGLQVNAIATLAVGIALYESGYDAGSVYQEPAPLNEASIGLFQLSYSDGFTWCKLTESDSSLKDPLNNIDCAVGEMAKLISRDHVVAAGVSGSIDSRQGLGRYWSTMWQNKHLPAIKASVALLPFCS